MDEHLRVHLHLRATPRPPVLPAVADLVWNAEKTGPEDAMGYAGLACRWLTGLVFLVAAVSKARDFAGFRRSLAALAPPRVGRSASAAAAVPAAELLVAVSVALPATAKWGLAAAFVLELAFMAAILTALRRGVHEPCRCFGASERRLGATEVTRDAVLAAVAALGLLGAMTGDPARQPAGWAVAALAGAVGALLTIRFDELTDLYFPQNPSRT